MTVEPPGAAGASSDIRECFPNLRRQASSSEFASGLKHAGDTGVHFLFLDEIAPGGSVQTPLHAGTETSVFLQQAQSGIPHKLLRVRADMIGDFGKLRFLL
jgi:hypothetical protein